MVVVASMMRTLLIIATAAARARAVPGLLLALVSSLGAVSITALEPLTVSFLAGPLIVIVARLRSTIARREIPVHCD
jgi:hypothetical protein